MRTSEFDYRLPPERIAQRPLPERDASRLLVLDRSTGGVSHRVFRELPELLEPGDLVVLNDTRVVPARLYGLREKTGGRVEALFLEEIDKDVGGGRWRALTRSGGKLKVGEWLKLAGGRVRARLVERHHVTTAMLEGPPVSGCSAICERSGLEDRGPNARSVSSDAFLEGDVLEVDSREPLAEVLDEVGHMPVPPYVRRDPSAPPDRLDRERYQTTYARASGAVAAPTAGLHFTDRVFDGLEARGIERTFVTLHVGPGTFRPVKSDDIEAHAMGPERYAVPPEAARAVRECRARPSTPRAPCGPGSYLPGARGSGRGRPESIEGRSGRVVAVGTTTVRTLESAALDGPSPRRSGYGRAGGGLVEEGPGTARIFITPGHDFRVVDALVTNFHLPRGTPLVLTCAFAGKENVFRAYEEALGEGYRFLSYGDAMLIL